MATNKRLIKSNDEAAGGASFNTVLYTGNGTTNPITGVGFQPDFVWIKRRFLPIASHSLQDSVRGTGTNFTLASNLTAVEGAGGIYGFLSSFDLDGFTVSAGSSGAEHTNVLSADYVAWCWRAGGAAVTNTDGTIISQVSANTEAGFSIVSYTGNGSVGNFGHGLSDSPSIVIIKGRSIAEDWFVLYDTTNTPPNYMKLNTTEAGSASSGVFPSPATSTVVNVGGGSANNSSGNTYIAYCFAEVPGFSKFGSYTGTGVARTIPLDFTPAFVMIKRTGTTGQWQIFDNKRSTYRLLPNYNFAESQTAGTNDEVTLVPNGFTLPTDLGNGNNSALAGNTYIYMAFANQF